MKRKYVITKLTKVIISLYETDVLSKEKRNNICSAMIKADDKTMCGIISELKLLSYGNMYATRTINDLIKEEHIYETFR